MPDQNPKSTRPEEADFRERRRDSEERGRDQGEHGPARKVTARDAGAKRDSFFRRRDYE